MINLPSYAKKGLIFKHRADYVTKEFKRLCLNHKLHDLRHTFNGVIMDIFIIVFILLGFLIAFFDFFNLY